MSDKERKAIWALWSLVLTAVIIGVAAPNLENHPKVTSDGVWIMSVSHKLTTEGVFGTDVMKGVFNADQYYFINLPAHHAWQAIFFRIFGTGVAQARWVALLSAVALIWIVGWLAFRWYGITVMLLTGVLMVFWQSNLIRVSPGLPLLAVARTGRYDVSAVAWLWLSLALLYWLVLHPGWIVAVTVGVCCGMAVLTQFFGAVTVPIIAIIWLWHRGRRALSDPLSYAILAGFGAVVGPYLFYAVQHSESLRGQMTWHSGRGQLGFPAFFFENILSGFKRFGHLVKLPALGWPEYQPVGPWLFVVTIAPACVYLGLRTRQKREIGDRMLSTSLVAGVGMLAVFESTKAPLYAIVLFPSVCLALAVFWTGLIRWAMRDGQRPFIRLPILGFSGMALLIVFVEGAGAYWIDRQKAADASRYLDIGTEIAAYLEAGAGVVGPERWWWALHDHPYLSMNNLWFQWHAAFQTQNGQRDFAEVVKSTPTRFIIVDSEIPSFIQLYPRTLQDQFWAFLDNCTQLVADFADKTYGRIRVFRVLDEPVAPLMCNP